MRHQPQRALLLGRSLAGSTSRRRALSLFASGLLAGLLPPRLDTAAFQADRDGDGLFDDDESRLYGTNPNLADSDGVYDGHEVNGSGTNPLNRDSDGDGDGIIDWEDIVMGSNGTTDGAPPANNGDPGVDEPYEPVEPMEPDVSEEEREKILSGGGGGGAGGGGTAGGGSPCDIEGACDPAEYREPFPEPRPGQE